MKQLMKKQLLLLSLFAMLAMPSVVQAQGWEKKFSLEDYNDAFSICQTKDSTYWLVGQSWNSYVSSYGTLIKLDKNGNKIFHKPIMVNR